MRPYESSPRTNMWGQRSQHPIDWWPSMHARNTGIFQLLWGAAILITAIMGTIFGAGSCVTYGHALVQVYSGLVIFSGPISMVAGVFGVSSSNGSSFLVACYLSLTSVSLTVGCGLGGMAVVNGLVNDATWHWLLEQGVWSVSEFDGATREEVSSRLAIDIVLAVLIVAEMFTAIIALTLTCCMPGCCQPDHPRVHQEPMGPMQGGGGRVPNYPGAPAYPPQYDGFKSPKPY